MTSARDQARELIAAGPPFEPGALGFERHAVYLSSEEVVFLFEGRSAACQLADMIDDMVTSASFSAWARLLKATPRIAHEHYFWKAVRTCPAEVALTYPSRTLAVSTVVTRLGVRTGGHPDKSMPSIASEQSG